MPKRVTPKMNTPRIKVLSSGQRSCHDADGEPIPCRGSWQDAELSMGIPWPEPRFELLDQIALDRLTGLTWTTASSATEFALPWTDCFDAVEGLNRNALGDRNDWRVPNRRELHSLISFRNHKPALPDDHPFGRVFLGWYWSSTTYANDHHYAWRVHTEGGRMFFGNKTEDSLLWPVCGQSPILPTTGQTAIFDAAGRDRQMGVLPPSPRFQEENDTVFDRFTGLCWLRRADLCGPVPWTSALQEILRFKAQGSKRSWRLPTIRELESLVDASRSFPALSPGHPFTHLGDAYWSSTSSSFEYDWAMSLYLNKGAIGVGFKKGEPFLVWPVSNE